MTDLSLPEFAKALYARPGVREACLYLQDEAGCDVVLVLAGAWMGAQGRQLSPREWQHLEYELVFWTASVVEPLRGVRRHLKGYPDALDLRERIRAAELEAELCSLQWLEVRLVGMGRSDPFSLDNNLHAVAVAGLTALIQRVIRAGIQELQEAGGP